MFFVRHFYINPCHSLYFGRIICSPIWGSLAVRDHLRSNLGIVCGAGSFAVLGSFADSYSKPIHCSDGISFEVGRALLNLVFGNTR